MPKKFTARAVLTDKEVSIHKVKEADRFHYLMLENDETQILLTFGDILMLSPTIWDSHDSNNTQITDALRMHLSLSNFHSLCNKHHDSMNRYHHIFSQFNDNTSLDFLDIITPEKEDSPVTLVLTQKEHDTPDIIHRNVLYFLKEVCSNIYNLLNNLQNKPHFTFNLLTFPNDLMRTQQGIDIDPEMGDRIVEAVMHYGNTQWLSDVENAYHHLSVNTIDTSTPIYTKCIEISNAINESILTKVRWTYESLANFIEFYDDRKINISINHQSNHYGATL